jgi:ankyrin repeat protein
VNAKDHLGRTPLHYCPDSLTAKVLLHCGADLLIRDNDGKTAFNHCNNEEIAEVIKSAIKKIKKRGN